ncbi:hypothetical protein GOEFS_069_00020 [Gordonia effusa NBRC 100432]|uniref:Uncharacterized protein n=1 Tax=Gordonia effusa NBRC 100432 TaxID=1077974 RepID=H0R1C5_9ACTN|nr:hypothetical protein [Gordonia effusa]GAB18876.1 hypothetical protein GOEFS_069_00020 [Gordonia effusa NBRC 100432]
MGSQISPDPDQPDRIPTQAELDADDLAEIARTSKDRDVSSLYPVRPVDPGPPPVALALHARVAWWGAAAMGLITVVYGFLNLGLISDLLRQRLIDGIAQDPKNASPADQVDSIAGFFPPFMLVMIVVFLAIEYPLLVGAANHHSRHVRNFFVATVVVNILSVPIGIDLLLRYPDVSSVMILVAWIQAGLLAISALCAMRRPVNRWLPESTRMKPSKMFRPGSR